MNKVAEAFGITDGQPTERMVMAVWGLLIRFGVGLLPDADQPKAPLGPWQPEIVRFFLANTYASLQGARQGTGKSFTLAMLLACYILLGHRIAIALPSLKQGDRVLIRRTSLFMAVLEPLFGITRETKGVNEKIWNNGGALFGLSASEMGLKGTQGYTVVVMGIDESHEILYKHLAFFSPLVAVAMKKRRGRFWLIGVGGSEDSSPEMVKNIAGWAHLTVNDEYISKLDDAQRERWEAEDEERRRAVAATGGKFVADPRLLEMPWREFFAGEEAKFDPAFYDQFYRCRPVKSGTRRVFPYMRDEVGQLRGAASQPFDDLGNHRSKRWGGVDVATGQGRDSTVAGVIERRGTSYNLCEAERVPHGLNFIQQERWLSGWFSTKGVPHGDIHIEVNGPGRGLFDICNDPKNVGLTYGCANLYGLTAVTLDYATKVWLVRELNEMMRPRGGLPARFGVEPHLSDPTVGNIGVHLAGLAVDFDGHKWDFEETHSDWFSMLLMCAHSMLMNP